MESGTLARKIYRTIRKLADRHGTNPVAKAAGMSASGLCNAMSMRVRDDGSRQRYLPIDALEGLMELEGGEEIAEVIDAHRANRYQLDLFDGVAA